MLSAARMILDDFVKDTSTTELTSDKTFVSSSKLYAPFPESTLVRYKNNRIPQFKVCCENLIKNELGASYCRVFFFFNDLAIKVTVSVSYSWRH